MVVYGIRITHNLGLEDTEGYSNPIADLGYKVLTHPSENCENMDEVIEVNEEESQHIKRYLKQSSHKFYFYRFLISKVPSTFEFMNL